MFEMKSYNVRCVGSISDLVRLTVSIFFTGVGPNLVDTSLFHSNCATESASSPTCLSNLPQIVLSTSKQNYFLCPAERSTHMCSLWFSGQAFCTTSNRNIVYPCVRQWSILYGMTSCSHPASPSGNYFRMHTPGETTCCTRD